MGDPSSSKADLETSLVRLHITPFTPDLLSRYLGSAQDTATDISYHTLPTFPDRPYGYVTVPAGEATKMKKKLNGAILKGTKVQIEEARPPKRKVSDDGDEVVEEKERKKARKEHKRRKDKVYEGHELEEGRSVKRGWTEPTTSGNRKDRSGKDKSADSKPLREKSKYSKEPELLFKTTIPPNTRPLKSADDVKKDKKKSKKSKGVVVHEFEKNKKHASFLKQAKIDMPPASQFVKGKGWVNEDGEVVENDGSKETDPLKVIRKSLPKDKTPKKVKKSAAIEPKQQPVDDASSVNSSSIPSDSDSESNAESSMSESESASSPPARKDTTVSTEPRTSPAAPTTETEQPKTPHPFEVLYKRSSGSGSNRPTPITTSFSFGFGGDDNGGSDADGDNDLPPQPQTPFAQHVEQRHIARSGAPTPDTAAAHRRFSFSGGAVDPNADEEEEDYFGAGAGKILSPVADGDEEVYDEDADMDVDPGAGHNGRDDGKEETAFAKWFWENRGENNRAWKRRRRDAMKEKRQRENKRLGRRVV